METKNRLPENFRLFHDSIASGLDGKINYKAVDQIKGRQCFSEFSSWGITTKIWWDRKENCWCAEIWKKGNYQSSLSGEAIEDLLFNVMKYHGWK